MPRCDVVVVGAGPAGTAFAHEIASAGFEVVILEREAAGRDKPCGEGVQWPGLAVLGRMGVLDEAWRKGAPFRRIRFEAGARAVELALAGVAIARTALDDLAARAAAGVGACIRWKAAGVELARKGAEWELLDSQGVVWRSPWVVGADGARSWVRRRLGLPVMRKRQRAGWVFHAPASDEDTSVRVLCEQDHEIYTVRIGGERRLVAWLGPSAWLSSDRKKALRRRLAARLRVAGVGDELDEGATIAPLSSQTTTGAGDGWLLLGDAAGQIDPILGMGISGALTSGIAGAHAIRAALHSRSSQYVEAYARNQARRLKHAALVAEGVLAAARRPGLWPAMERILGMAPDLPETIERTLFPDEMEHEYALPNLRPLLAFQP